MPRRGAGLRVRTWTLLLLVGACGPSSSADRPSETSSTTEAAGSSSASTVSSTSASASASASASSDPTSSGADASSESGRDGDASTTSPDPGCEPLTCDGHTRECIDEQDNDLDGLVDLLDPECTSACDDDEGAFQHGVPRNDSFCKGDCYFDANLGMGDDGCMANYSCDPREPKLERGCEYNPQNCPDEPPTPECIAACAPFVLPGCDCFGCCTVETREGPKDIYLGSGLDCRLADLSACSTCTSQIDECGNPCTPENCEICFGESDPPPACVTNVCDNGLACVATNDCPCGHACLLGCCLPLPE